MTSKQTEHLKKLVQDIGKLVENKYRKGQKAHGGNLFDLTARQLCKEAICEAVDQLTYLLTLLPKLPPDKETPRK